MSEIQDATELTLALNEEQEMLVKTARDFVDQQCPVGRLRDFRGDHADGFDRGVWAQMAELGFSALTVPEAHDGLGLGFFELCLVLQQAGRRLVSEPLVSTALISTQALILGGSDAAREAWLPGIAAGEKIVTLAFEEAGMRFRYDDPKVTARADGAEFVLDGAKAQVLDAHVADGFIVSAAAGDGVGLFIVPSDAAGVTVTRQARLDIRNAGIVTLEGVRVGSDAILAEPFKGAKVLDAILQRAAIGLAAEMLGSAEQAFADTIEYIKERKQFDRPLGSFQALQHRAARQYVELSLLRSAVLGAARAVDDAPALVPKLAALAKARANDTYLHVAKESIQMHGGVGMTDEFDVGFYLKRAQASAFMFGDTAYHASRWADVHGY